MAWLKSAKAGVPAESQAVAVQTLDRRTPDFQKIWRNPGVPRATAGHSFEWSTDRAVNEAMRRVVWVYSCVRAISSNAAKSPTILRRGNSWDGEIQSPSPLVKLLNGKPNPGQSAFQFKATLSQQLLLSTKGVFIEVSRDRRGNVARLEILPPDSVTPHKHPTEFVDYYDVSFQDQNRVRQSRRVPAKKIVWIRNPHPFDPYKSLTPLESAGVAIETDWYARLYNRNFLLNDGRPGGIVVLKGDILEDDKEEIRSRFRGGLGMAGRVAVLASSAGADWVDTAVNPRDAQYIEGRKNTKEEIIIAFGVAESVLGNASGRTWDNAETERQVFWMETMLPHLDLIYRDLDVLEDDDNNYLSIDLSRVDVLQRMDIKRKEYALKELDTGGISVDEYREATGRQPLAFGRGAVLLRPVSRIPWLTTDGSEVPVANYEEVEGVEDPLGPQPEGRPQETDPNVSEDDPVERENDERLEEMPNAKALDDLILELEDLEVLESIDTSEYERQVMGVMSRLLERQERVVQEKLKGQKMRRFFAKRARLLSEGPVTGESTHETSILAALKIMYDRDVWDKQATEDLEPILEEFRMKSGAWMFSPDLSSLNASIEKELDVALAAGTLGSLDPEEIVNAASLVVESVFSAARGRVEGWVKELLDGFSAPE